MIKLLWLITMLSIGTTDYPVLSWDECKSEMNNTQLQRALQEKVQVVEHNVSFYGRVREVYFYPKGWYGQDYIKVVLEKTIGLSNSVVYAVSANKHTIKQAANFNIGDIMYLEGTTKELSKNILMGCELNMEITLMCGEKCLKGTDLE